MKKRIIILTILIFILTLTGCSTSKNTEDSSKINSKEVDSNNNENNLKSNNKELIVYFSAKGTTEKVAKLIADVTSADIIKIEPKQKYTDADLNYNNENSRANKEQNDKNSRPKISNKINIDEYGTIYIGYPIWWGKNPRIILTLLDSYNFDNKNVILFCTSGSSGIETSINDIKQYNSKLNVLGGKRFDSSVTKEEIESWIKTFK